MITKYTKSVLNSRTFWGCMMVIVLLKCALLRLRMPSIAFIDDDIAGYLNPALNLLNGEHLRPAAARGIYYPLFSWINILISGSINSITLAQHLLGLIGLFLIVFSFNSLLSDRYLMLKKGLTLTAIAILGFNYDIILLEHTIRPDGLILFLAGSIFFLLRNFYLRPNTFFFILLEMALTITAVLMPKFSLGCLVIGAYGIFKYLANGRFVIIALVVLSAMIIFSWQQYLNRTNNEAQYFLPRNFFYANALIIQRSAGFEKNFSLEEKNAVKIAVDSSFQNPSFHLLGFNPDGTQYRANCRYN